MKILQLGKFYPIRGGVEKVMWDLTRALAVRAVDCDMLCAYDKPSMRREDRSPVGGEIVFNAHGRCICVPALCKLSATMIAPAMVSWLRRHCREYDIIHIHHPDPMAAVALGLSGYKGRVILHWHSDILKQKALLKFYKPIQSWIIRRADTIVGTSPVYVRESPYLAGVQDKVTFAQIGIEKIAYNARKVVTLQQIVGNRKIVFGLGRLVAYKGFSYLVDAARYLPDDYMIVIGGMGVLEAGLREQIERNGLDGKVRLLGYLEDEDARAWMGACDVFVLSSVLRTEAFGIVQLEAMSCGKPVVATRIPGSGTAWVNADGESGINVPVRDSKALADAILKITADAATYESFSKRALHRYEEMFTTDVMVEKILKIYNLK